MAGRSNAVLELKSKSVNIDNLAGWPTRTHPGGLVAEQSDDHGPGRDPHRHPGGAPACGGAVRPMGVQAGFSFRPDYLHEGWQEGYRHTIRQLFATVPAEAIVWISLGALRYLPSLKQIAAERFPASRIFYQEFIEGLDGKRRYFRSERVALYRCLVDELRQHADPRTCIYFCMENDTIWKQVFGFTPAEKGGLSTMLDRSVRTMI
jgi:spore photoproduct lyase